MLMLYKKSNAKDSQESESTQRRSFEGSLNMIRKIAEMELTYK